MVDDDGKEVPSGNFHVGYFLMTLVKKALNCCGCTSGWKQTQSYIDVSEEACQQIDIAYMARKLMFLDLAVAKLL